MKPESEFLQYSKKGWYQDVPELMKRVDRLYERLVEKGAPDKWTLTRDKIIEARGWAPATRYILPRFQQVLQQMPCFYIPKNFHPGPMFVFPVRDVYGNFIMAQSKPLYPFLVNREGEVMKYAQLGSKAELKGPAWLGNDPETIASIIKQRAVMLVEGPFDILAARLLAPENLPILSPLTKTVGRQHLEWLRILGVEKLFLMFDNEEAKHGRKVGAGNESMDELKYNIEKRYSELKVNILLCQSDPSDALRTALSARALTKFLHSIL
jgi:hypothetical protein